MRKKDNGKYNFVVSHTSTSQIYIRRIEISKRILHGIAGVAVISIGCFSYITYGIVSSKVEIAKENQILREQNDLQQQELNQLLAQVPAAGKNTVKNAFGNTENVIAKTGGPETTQFLTENTENSQPLISVSANNGYNETVPAIWPRIGKINNEFGWRRNPFGGRSYESHPGIDIDGEKGDPIISPANGIVLKAGWQGGYGNLIEIDHGNGLTTRYGHLSKVDVEIGQEITRGQQVGLLGSTGRSTGPHLHYEVRIDNEPVNPRNYLPPVPEIEVNQ